MMQKGLASCGFSVILRYIFGMQIQLIQKKTKYFLLIHLEISM